MMEAFIKRREELEKEILRIITERQEKKELTEENIAQIASFVVRRIEAATTEDELLTALYALGAQWNFFEPLIAHEQGGIKQRSEEKVVDKMVDLLHTGHIEEAIAAGKQATNAK